MPELLDGQTAEVWGSGSKPYQLKNVGGVYSCSCPAWRNQSRPIDRRSCKHIRQFRGEAAEQARLGCLIAATSTIPPGVVTVRVPVWAPVGTDASLGGDSRARVQPRLLLGGTAGRFRWALNLSLLFRGSASAGSITAANEAQLGIGLAYASRGGRFQVGPEVLLATALEGGLRPSSVSIEALLGMQYAIAGQVRVGIAAGTGFFDLAGTSDVRALVQSDFSMT